MLKSLRGLLSHLTSSGSKSRPAENQDGERTSAGDCREPAMPALRESRREIYSYYRMQFLPDGYPGKRTDKGLVPHPIYGTYVILDYLSQYRQTKDTRYLDAARTVADAALSRMTEVGEGEGLAFLYTPEMALSSLPGSFFSGLTQARYVDALSILWRDSGDDRYAAAAARCLESLFIPVDRGGVLREAHGGAVIEEWPHMMMGDYTLNGWTTAILLVADYARRTGSKSAKALADRNLDALENLLPLYDMPEIANSRYRLSGKFSVKLDMSGTAVRFVRGAVDIPGEGVFPIGSDDTSRWHNYARLAAGRRRLTMNVNLNYASFPAENTVDVELAADRSGSARIRLPRWDWSPTGPVPEAEWVEAGSVALHAGVNRIVLPIPWDKAPYVAAPTDFTKKINGRNYNSYHFIHFRNLRALLKHRDSDMFRHYADRWESYTKAWPSMPLYADTDAVLERFKPASQPR